MTEKYLHEVFELSVLIKGFLALLETLGGFTLFFLNKNFFLTLILNLTHEELADGSNHFVINYLIQHLQNLSISTQYFTAFYLLSHGLIKLFLIIGLLKNKHWAYPTAIVVFSFFTLYQFYLMLVSPSLSIFTITILDLIMIGLTYHEWKLFSNKVSLS